MSEMEHVATHWADEPMNLDQALEFSLRQAESTVHQYGWGLQPMVAMLLIGEAGDHNSMAVQSIDLKLNPDDWAQEFIQYALYLFMAQYSRLPGYSDPQAFPHLEYLTSGFLGWVLVHEVATSNSSELDREFTGENPSDPNLDTGEMDTVRVAMLATASNQVKVLIRKKGSDEEPEVKDFSGFEIFGLLPKAMLTLTLGTQLQLANWAEDKYSVQ